ncbi:SDR family NAD(P)-dependent oxidoreductase, partial [Parvibaculum sp.]|uniref:SDR family NAD(P)-dependent oxidoreductase n=1 Tax=Parvibaculum sp. TaxID=2024848 RepID=UPI0025F0C918
MKLDGSISAVVTGGASGLGKATVTALRAAGVKVAIFDVNKENGERVAKELGATYCEVNVMDEASVDAGFGRAREANGQERCLVNCAGGGRGGKTIGRDKKTGEIIPFKISDFEYVLGLNTVGTFRCIVKSAAGMAALDPLEGGERGAIVNTGSVAAEDGQIGQVAYSAAKAAIKGLTLTIARDLCR